MTSLVAIIPVASLIAANAALEEAGFGPRNFSVPAYSDGGASHAALHAWDDASFADAVKAIPGVEWEESDGDPVARTKTLIEEQGAWWGAQVAALPDTGTITAGEMYHYADTLYQVLVTHSRDTWGGDPEQWPTYIRRIRKPGEVKPWETVRDRFDAYYLVNPFTGLPDQCTHNGWTWTVTGGNAAGTNTWEPGVFGWTSNQPVNEWPDFVQPMAGDPPYMTGAKVTFNGKHYICNRDNVTHSPASWPAAWDAQLG